MTARELDQFYTSPELAEQLVKHLITKFGDTFLEAQILEPSAGEGAFSDCVLGRGLSLTAVDLDPKRHYIEKADFMTWQPEQGVNYFSVGNPPFGKNASLAVAFFNRCALFSSHIAFIIPNTFKKNSLKDRLDLNFHLVDEVELPQDSFIFEGQPYSVPCCFQVWRKQPDKRELTPKYETEDFTFVTPEQADLAIQRVGANAGKITLAPHAQSKSPNSHLFVAFNRPGVMSAFISTDFTKYKWCTAGNPSIAKQEILEAWCTKG